MSMVGYCKILCHYFLKAMEIKKISTNGYHNCIEVSNNVASMVIEPDCGGRILSFKLGNSDVIYKNPLEDGYLLESGEPPLSNLSPCAGRCDIGPEFLTKAHPELWLGKWQSNILPDGSVELISKPDSVTGLQLRRLFVLDEHRARLTFTQTMKNISGSTRRCFHWSRTFFTGGGVAIAPINKNSRYPFGYLTYGPGDVINYFPKVDKNLVVDNGLLQIIGPTSAQKYAMDLSEGWLAYQTTESVLVIKTFPVYDNRIYGEVAANNMSFWYNGTEMCEVEPIGPLEILQPGEEASFTEVWNLFKHDYSGINPIDSTSLDEKLSQCS
jgi:hypothetical protein